MTRYENMIRSVANLAKDAGMTWSDFERIAAVEFGAVLREGRIDGWMGKAQASDKKPSRGRK